MDRFSGTNYVTIGGLRFFVDLNLSTNTPGSFPNALWFNGAQESLLAPVTAAGLVPSDGDNTQLLQAVKAISGGNVTSVTASAALTPLEAGLVEINATAGNIVVTLPAANAVSLATRFKLVRTDGTANTVTINAVGGAYFFPSGLTTFTMASDQVTDIVSDQTNWIGSGSYVTPAALAAALSPYAQSPPVVVTSGVGTAIGAGYSGSVSASFTAPAAGTVVAFGGINLNTPAAAGSAVVYGLSVNGTVLQTDSTQLSQVHHVTAAVTAGESVVVAGTATSTGTPAVAATYHVGYFFIPNA